MPAHTHAPAKPAWANPYDSPAVQCFEQVLGVRPVILYAEQIAAEVTDLTQWKDTLEFWRRKNYRKSSVDKMLHNYREHATQAAAVIELPPAPKPQPTDAEILALMRQMAASNDIGDIQTLKSQAAQIAERGGPQIEWEYFVCEHVQLGARRGLRAVK